MRRRDFLATVGAGVFGVDMGAHIPVRAAESKPAADSRSRPNVLFIAVDDLRPELGCYGNALIQSPNIDRLAARGRIFRRAYCQQAVCSPSRSSLLTGTRPDTTRVWDLKTHFRAALPDVVTLPQHFRNNGYFVQGMGKIYHGGYDDPPSWSVPWIAPKAPRNAAPAQNENKKPAAADSGGVDSRKRNRGPAFLATEGPDNALHDGALADWAIEALKARKGEEQPFFLAVGFVKPHLPFVSPRKYWDLYDPAQIPLAPNPYPPEGAPAYAFTDSGELRNYEGVPDVPHLPDDFARQLKHGYYAAVSYMDAQVGRVLDELDALGLADNTIIALWGDHGWKLGEHDRWCKHSNAENDTNAPLIIAAPGMDRAGEHSGALVEFVDIYPTLTELAGLALPGHLEGSSAVPLLSDPTRPWKAAAFSQYPRSVDGRALMGYSMRTSRYRLTCWVERDNPENIDAVELYDHENDPQENRNIAGVPENKETLDGLLAQWRGGWRAARPR